MKTILILLTVSALISPSSVLACNVFLKTKDAVPVHEEAVLVVEYHETHRNCPLALSSIKVSSDGMTILSATSWKQTGSKTYQRKFKVRVEEADCFLNFNRSCEKGGLSETLSVETR